MSKIKWAQIGVIFLIFAIGFFYFMTIRDGHDWGSDFAMYIHHAKNIAEGEKYSDTGYIYNPDHPISPRTYPPIFPIILTPVYKWYGLDLNLMKAEVILFFLFWLYIIFLSFKEELPYKYIMALIAIMGLNPYFWFFKDNVLSDIPFSLFFWLSLYLISEWYKSNQGTSGGKKLLYPFLTGIAIYLAYGTRSIGIVLIPSLFIYEIIKFRRPTLMFYISTMVWFLLALIQNTFLHTDSDYLHLLSTSGGWMNIISANSLAYYFSLSTLWYNGFSFSVTLYLFAVTGMLSLAGFIIKTTAKLTIIEVVILLYMAIILTWPATDQGLRLIIPIIPFFIFYIFYALENARRLSFFARNQVVSTIAIILIAAIFISYTGRYSRTDFGPIQYGIGKRETLDLFNYIRAKTDERDVFIFRKPRVLALYTGRSSSIYHEVRPSNDEELWDYFKQIRASYLINGVGREVRDKEYIISFIKKYADRFSLVYANPDFRVYKILY